MPIEDAQADSNTLLQRAVLLRNAVLPNEPGNRRLAAAGQSPGRPGMRLGRPIAPGDGSLHDVPWAGKATGPLVATLSWFLFGLTWAAENFIGLARAS